MYMCGTHVTSLLYILMCGNLCTMYIFCSEYQSLDRQLDQLDAYLTVMESRSDKLTQDARQLLQEVQESRQNGTQTSEDPDKKAA